MATSTHSVVGFRPFHIPGGTGINSAALYSSLLSRAVPSSSFRFPTPAPTLRTEHHAQSDSDDRNSALAIVLPVFFGSLFFVALFFLFRWHRRRGTPDEEQELRGCVGSSSSSRPKWATDDRPWEEAELLDSFKAQEDLARLDRSASFRTFNLPRKPPPAYEP
ncbi:hypothetical protein JCM10207_005351 [Rhodosporidiobolus poonsookiae]